jgi:tetratricopeptide (TPR) repeat protein
MQAYDKATEIDPEYKEAWYNKGIALADQGKYDDAIKAYDKAIEINPKYAEAWHNKGIALEKRGRTKVANDARKDADASAANAAIKNAIMYGYKS